MDFYDIYYTNMWKMKDQAKNNLSDVEKKLCNFFSLRETKNIPSRK